MKEEFFKILLDHFGIQWSEWGKTATTKPLSRLAKEVATKETVLEIGTGITRCLGILYLDVSYQGKILVEDRAEWKDGRPPRRRTLLGSLAEKLTIGEAIPDAAVRALKEELSIVVDASRIAFLRTETSYEDSPSFPGLQARFANHVCSVELTSDEYRPDGYTENQPDKTTFFVWQ